MQVLDWKYCQDKKNSSYWHADLMGDWKGNWPIAGRGIG